MNEIFKLFDENPIIPIGLGTFLILLALLRKRKESAVPVKQHIRQGLLSQVLYWWSPHDTFPIRDLLRSVVIFGASGSGKSSGSGYQLAKAIVGHPKTSGLILASKPEDREEFWEKIFRTCGRRNDLLVFGPDEPLRFDPIDFLQKSGASTRDITQAIMVTGDIVEQTTGRESEPFWRREKGRWIYNAVEVVQMATGRASAPDVQRFIHGAAHSPAELQTPEWREGFHSKCLEAASKNLRTSVQKYDYQLAADGWLREYPAMADKMRTSIVAEIMGTLHVLNTGEVRELLSTTTNVSPADMDEGKWIFLDMPISSFGLSGAAVLGIWKYSTQYHILKRKASENTPVCVIHADEAQKVVNPFDSAFLAECRSHRGCMVYLTQSIHSFYTRMREAGEHEADSFLTNFGTKVFHALGDDKTADYASSLIGQKLHTDINVSASAPEDAYEAIWGNPRVTASSSQSVRKILQNRSFMQGLRTGGEEHGCVVDALVVKSGEPFSTGEAWMKVSFSQR